MMLVFFQDEIGSSGNYFQFLLTTKWGAVTEDELHEYAQVVELVDTPA
jgi:hypothetical protein